MAASEHEDGRSDSREAPESVGAFVKVAIVKCQGFRCLAYLGHDGKWRNEHGEVLDVVEVINVLP